MDANLSEAGGGEPTGDDWEQVRPVLDEALAGLSAADREAILLRYFQGCGFAEVGERLDLSENSARMRVERALDKLHGLLARRGVTSTTTALATVLANQAVTAAPAGLAAAVTGTALAGASAVGAVTIFMGITKTQVALLGALVAAGAGGLKLQQRANAQMAAEITTLRSVAAGNEAMRQENRRLANSSGEAQALRGTSGLELARLSEEAATLKTRLTAEAKSAGTASPRSGGSGKPAAIFDLAQLDQVPTARFRVPPTYPDQERVKGMEGKALVEFVLGADGKVAEARAVEATNDAFAASAVEALSKWKFDPGKKGGVPVGVRMRQPITFTLSTPTWWF